MGEPTEMKWGGREAEAPEKQKRRQGGGGSLSPACVRRLAGEEDPQDRFGTGPREEEGALGYTVQSFRPDVAAAAAPGRRRGAAALCGGSAGEEDPLHRFCNRPQGGGEGALATSYRAFVKPR